MKLFEFTIIASGLDPDAPDFADRFFEAGCDDATISFQKGVIILEFEREAPNFAKALVSAVVNVYAAGARVERFEPDHLVSLSDIAKRTGVTRAAISNYSRGERLNSTFPSPVARVTSDTPLWDWAAVAKWLHEQHKLDAADVVRARIVREANLVVETRDLGHDKLVQSLERAVELEDA